MYGAVYQALSSLALTFFEEVTAGSLQTCTVTSTRYLEMLTNFGILIFIEYHVLATRKKKKL